MNLDGVKQFVIGVWAVVLGVLPGEYDVNKQHVSTTPIPSPIVEIQPSQRALAVAAYIYTHANEQEKQKWREKHGVIKSSNPQEVKEHAIWLDKNPEALALNEAQIEKFEKDKVSVNTNRQPKQAVPQAQSGYTNDVNELNRRLDMARQAGIPEEVIRAHLDDFVHGRQIPLTISSATERQQNIVDESQVNALRDDLREQDDAIRKLKQEQENRTFWENHCAISGKQYNSQFGFSCR